jgi:hypothetical protein
MMRRGPRLPRTPLLLLGLLAHGGLLAWMVALVPGLLVGHLASLLPALLTFALLIGIYKMLLH